MALIVDFSDLGGYKALILKPYQGFAKVCAFGNPLILNCNQNFMGLLKNPFFFKRQIWRSNEPEWINQVFGILFVVWIWSCFANWPNLFASGIALRATILGQLLLRIIELDLVMLNKTLLHNTNMNWKWYKKIIKTL